MGRPAGPGRASSSSPPTAEPSTLATRPSSPPTACSSSPARWSSRWPKQSYDGKDGLEPARWPLAWEGAADGRSITFQLREGVTWHDGKPFTSADVAFSALEVWKPLQNLGRVVFKNLEAVETPDERTAVFRFSAPTPFQLIRNALPVVDLVCAEACLCAAPDITKNPANSGPDRHRSVQARRAHARANITC